MQNENQISITSLEWNSATELDKSSIAFADKEGYIGVFDVPLPNEEVVEDRKDPLIEDSLLMEVNSFELMVS